MSKCIWHIQRAWYQKMEQLRSFPNLIVNFWCHLVQMAFALTDTRNWQSENATGKNKSLSLTCLYITISDLVIILSHVGGHALWKWGWYCEYFLLNTWCQRWPNSLHMTGTSDKHQRLEIRKILMKFRHMFLLLHTQWNLCTLFYLFFIVTYFLPEMFYKC